MSPPPTITYDQRARLLRSTRKLEALLGTTPDIVEPVSPRTERAHRREGRIFAFPPSSASSSSSSSSLDEDAVVLEKPHPLLELSIKVDALKKRDTSKDRSKPLSLIRSFSPSVPSPYHIRILASHTFILPPLSPQSTPLPTHPPTLFLKLNYPY